KPAEEPVSCEQIHRRAFPPSFAGMCGWVICANNWQLDPSSIPSYSVHGAHMECTTGKGGCMTPPTAGSTLVIALLLLCTTLTAAAATVASPASQTGELSPQQPQTPPATIVGNDGAEMLLVPAGEFIMGSDADEIARLALKQEFVEDEMPRHRVYLDT